MIAICVGHSRIGDEGAVSVGDVSEWHFNFGIAQRVARKLEGLGYDVSVISKYPREGYGEAMVWLGSELKKIKATVTVELHFNSSDEEQSNGHEWLHWHASPGGRKLARCLQAQMGNTFPHLKSRGLVPVGSVKKRGGLFLQRTPCPAVICEPFFGSNRDEWDLFSDQRDMLAEIIALGIDDWKGGAR